MKLLEAHYQSDDHARYYSQKHDSTPRRRMSNKLERRMMARAIERIRRHGTVETVLDLPSGTGRFIPVLHNIGARIIAMDTAGSMLREGVRVHADPADPHRPVVGSALEIPLKSDVVDVVFCARLLHHFPDDERRSQVFRELARVARLGVVVSFFDAGSYYAWKRERKIRRTGRESGRYAMSRAHCEDLAKSAGLDLLGMNAMFRFHSEITAAAFLVNHGATRD